MRRPVQGGRSQRHGRIKLRTSAADFNLNLVLWPWNPDQPQKVGMNNPSDRLPKNQLP